MKKPEMPLKYKTIPEWNQYAKRSGYRNIKDMIHHLYWKKQMPSRQVAIVLDVTCQRLLQLMDKLEIKRRSRGGPNR